MNKFVKLIDAFLNQITMYRLVLYCLLIWLGFAAILGWAKILPYNPLQIVLSALFLTAVAYLVNWIFAKIFEAPSNPESSILTALILALIIKPAKTPEEYIFLAWAAALAVASKYIFAVGKKHSFNPAAVAVLITAYFAGQSANWWVGTAAMFPLVFLGGALIVRKIQRFDLVLSAILVAMTLSFSFGFARGSSIATLIKQCILDSPIWFFSFVMLTEPLTTPPTKGLQILYGALTGFLFAPQTHIGGFYFTPEAALVTANIFSYMVSPKQKLTLYLKQKIRLTPSVYDFVFVADKNLRFKPGQYLEWTLGHKQPDNRGSRRYFTIASSPTEPELRMGVKFYSDSSTYKDNLLAMPRGGKIIASQLAGDFTLPKKTDTKLAFIAGGIGITPFRSMLKYLLDTGTSRPITVFYGNRYSEDIAYKDILDQAEQRLGIKVVYLLTDQATPPDNLMAYQGRITPEIIKKEMPDYRKRTFMISGPRAMVQTTEQILTEMGVQKKQIKSDFFPGFA